MNDEQINPRVATGVAGLDNVLQGGLPEGHVYLVEGAPGTGKTTLGLQFLLAGQGTGQRRGSLYITLSQTAAELEKIATSHGFDLSDVTIIDLLATEIRDAERAQSVLHTSEEELARLMQAIEQAVDDHDPDRVVIDSLSELRLVSSSTLRFRRSLIGLKIRLAERNSTTLMIDGLDEREQTKTAELIAHGAVLLDWKTPDYGVAHRRLRVVKLRGAPFVEGFHDLRIETGGVEISPRLVPRAEPVDIEDWEVRSGVDEFDALCGGGLAGNGTTLISGSTGSGKSTLGTLFAHHTVERGHPACIFLFEEMEEDFLKRAKALGMALDDPDLPADCSLIHVDPAEVSPGEVFDRIVEQVERGVRLIVLDSLTGFFHALPDGRDMLVQFTAILNFLKRQKVAVLMSRNTSGPLDPAQSTDLDISFVADNLILLQQYQADGHVERAVSVIKKRYGKHSRAVRTMDISESGVSFRESSAATSELGGRNE